MNKELYNYYLSLISNGDIPSFLIKYLSVPSLIRLKEISYFCGMNYASKDVYFFKEDITRYDHSLTTALLTWKLTENKKSTLAALFHDIATPCFSHVIDYMNKDYEEQESTEKYTSIIIENDKILQKYLREDNISSSSITNFKKYSIVDNKRPKLCTDRFDGIILPGISWTKEVCFNDIKELVTNLDVYLNTDNEYELGFKTLSSALKALTISNNIDKCCHSSEDNYMMELLAKITKLAIYYSLIKYEDLYYLDEQTLFNILENCNIDELTILLNEFKNKNKNDIPKTIIDNVKIKNLNPLVNGKRLVRKI